MIYNGVTEYLRRWCREMEERYRSQDLEERAKNGQNLLFVKRSFYDEMAYKLSTMVDWDADSFENYRERVKAMVPVRKAYVLRNEQDPKTLALLQDAEEEFLSFLGGVTAADSAKPEHYLRVIAGEEKERLQYAILEKWGYSTAYWYPLKGGFDERKLFLSAERFEPYLDRLCALLGLPGNRVYACGESYFDNGQCAEVDDLFGYGGNEVAYLPKDLSWIIYFSHEDTVTFAGTIVPMVMELLAQEREHWNHWD